MTKESVTFFFKKNSPYLMNMMKRPYKNFLRKA